MNNTIWKIALENIDEQTIEMPANAEILSAQMQSETLCIWAMVNPRNEKVKRIFHIFGTGHSIPEAKRKFIGTYQLYEGALVFHLFEVL
jgi:hypothetical protein